MENKREINLDDLGTISGGKLNEAQIMLVDAIIERARKEGKTMEWLVNVTEDPEAKEYIRAHW